MNKTYIEDFNRIIDSGILPLSELKRKKIIITGATGLIGSYLLRFLSYANEKLDLGCKPIAITRNVLRAKQSIGDFVDSNAELLECDINKDIPSVSSVDYIIHGAAPTSSLYFIEHPVDTILANITGTRHMLELAIRAKSASAVFLSSMEIYGDYSAPSVTEDSSGGLKTMLPRNSYPESKRLCETLCASYAVQYGVPIKVARLSQCLGPGASIEDSRAAISFASSVFKGHNIVLHTKGNTARCYCYLADAISGILTILAKGKTSDAYNIASDNTYCSIYDMAVRLTNRHSESTTRVIIESESDTNHGYAPEFKQNLSTDKLKSLGWKPLYNLDDAFDRLLDYWKLENTQQNEISCNR